MRRMVPIVSVVMLSACIGETNFVFQGVMPDATDARGDAETVSLDGIGEVPNTGDVAGDAECVPQCDGRQCGPDGCGGTCGECDDKNPCTTDSCDAKTGQCGFVPVEGQGAEPGCDDGNPCTTDSCSVETGKCQSVAVADPPEPACDNESKCDGSGRCQDGLCMQDSPMACNDGNPCTTDACDNASGECKFEGAADGPMEGCGDNDLCNGEETCVGGMCTQGTAVACDDENPCTSDSCNLADGQCDFVPVEDGEEVDCDDGNPCTKDLCTSGACDNPLFPIEDLAGPIAGGECLCKTDEDCGPLNDANLCNGVLHCVAGPEGLVPDGTLVCQVDADTIKEGIYDDGLWCNGLETCDPATGEKVAGVPPVIDDGIECTVDSCDEENDGLMHVPDSGLCGDGDACNGDEVCDAAKGCVPGAALVCNDGSVCTGTETCDAVQGCLPGVPLVCDDGSACSENQCDPKTGCVFPAISCDDKSLCTNDGCHGLTGCFHTPVSCADEVFCTKEACDPLKGCLHTPDDPFCDDGNPCTEDLCDPKSDCIHSIAALNGAACDDGNACTLGDKCGGGSCVSGTFDEPNCGDFDHDGVLNKDDSCPYDFDPAQLDLDADGKKDACEPLPAGFANNRKIALAQDGKSSTWRRTHEPVEVPLANGIIDDSVALRLKLDGNTVDSSLSPKNVTNSGTVPSGGAFGAGSAGMGFDNNQARIIVEDGALCPGGGQNKPFSVSLWFRVDSKQEGGAYLVNGAAPCDGMSLDLNPEGQLQLSACTDAACSSHVEPLCGAYAIGAWQHLVAVWDGATLQGYVDGALACSASISQISGAVPGRVNIGGNPAPTFTYPFKGSMDEFLMFSRALTPDEIETYYRSKAPYGTKLAPSSQADFDDIRVTEKSGTGDPSNTGETVKRSRILGPRPHSDTPCPMAQDDGTWKDREDLCGVVGYWRVDGDGKDAGPNKLDGTLKNGAAAATGRFGDGAGSVSFDGGDDSLESASSAVLEQLGKLGVSFTVEAWVNLNPGASCGPVPTVAFKGNGGGFPLAFDLCVQMGCEPQFTSTNGTKTLAVTATSGIGKGTWHHLAGVRDQSSKKLLLYVDGLLVASETDSWTEDLSSKTGGVWVGTKIASPSGWTGAWPGRIDDVLIHSVAKSPDYIYHRANAGVPKVQFLANTVVNNQGTEQAPAYPMREYSMYWGKADAGLVAPYVSSLPDAPAVVPDKCYGMLNGCHGYAGWWRFNEGWGTVAVDSSGWKNNGGLTAQGWNYTAGPEGTGLKFAGSAGFVAIPNSSTYAIPSGAIELSVAPGQAVNGSWSGGPFVLWKEVTGFADDWYSYFGADDGKLAFRIDAVGGVAHWVSSDQSVWAEGQSHPVAFLFGKSGMKMYVDYLVQQQTKEYTGGIGGTANLGVGANLNAGGSNFFKGTLDGLRISSRGLTPDEFLHYPMVSWGYAKGNWAKDCGGIICPELAGYDVTCNPQGHCEYANKDKTGWKKWDVWIWVPPGRFWMGSPGSEDGHESDESPVHLVTFAKGYFIGKYEIVVAQYEACVADGGKCSAASTADWDAYGWKTNTSTNN
ncbi:MAG: hypothetical protein FJ109_16350, partial [Deltaproteobacteria bacterium]|nr:hypothetical protein [Deltaproteobacteria bacterium]